MFPYAPVRWVAASRYPSIERVGRLTLPKLFLHARDDEVIPYGHGRRLFEAAAEPKEFVALGGGHGDAFEVDSAAYFGSATSHRAWRPLRQAPGTASVMHL